MAPNPNNQNQQWAPIWAGLVVDSGAKHYQRMKNAIWLFLYLLVNADRGRALARKVKTISSEMGIKRDTILRWLNILRRHGYIATQSTGRGLLIQIRDWGNPSSDIGKSPFQKQRVPNSCGWENPATEKAFKSPNVLNSSKKPDFPVGPIDTINNILNNDIDIYNENPLGLQTPKGFTPRTQKELLAVDIAKALDDTRNLPLYISYARRFSETLLRKVLGEVKEIPTGKIKKSRGALFNYLVQKYAKETS